MKKLKNKNRDAQRKRPSHKVRGVSPGEAVRESMARKICERGIGFEPGVMDGESGEFSE